MSTANPAPLKASVEHVSRARAEAEAVRLEHLAHESSVRSIGTMYYFGGFWMLFVGGSLVESVVEMPVDRPARDIGTALLVLSAVSFVVGWVCGGSDDGPAAPRSCCRRSPRLPFRSAR
jgi:hypothetical protein